MNLDRQARAYIASIHDPGDPYINRILASGNLAKAIREAEARSRPGATVDWAQHAADHRSRIIIPGDAGWPVNLTGPTAPYCLWVTGSDEALSSPDMVSIVGSRAATQYGTAVASDLASELSMEGKVIVSGGAYGIDAAAHRSTLAANGRTVVVLAGGIDNLYPSSHKYLFGEVVHGGGALITERPPGTVPIASRFLSRNRIIAGMASALVVVEASMRSRALNAARDAYEQGVPVGAFPGPVTSEQSRGCHHLIRHGQATLITKVEHVLDLTKGVVP